MASAWAMLADEAGTLRNDCRFGSFADVFVSYKSERRLAIEHLARLIENNGDRIG